jgi:ATP-dependent DNA helicase RecG
MTHTQNPAEIEIAYLKGVGPRKAEALNAIGIETIADLLYYFPRRYLDRSRMMSISQLTVGAQATIVGVVRTHGLLRARKTFLEVLISDDTGTLPLIWFAGIKYYEKKFKRGMTLSVSGTVTDFRGIQLVHPEIEVIFEDEEEEKLHTGRIIPLYPSTEPLKRIFLDSRGFRRIIKPALDQYADHLDDLIPKTVSTALQLLDLPQAVRQMHYPDDFAMRDEARRSLAQRELLLFQILVADRRLRATRKPKPQQIIAPDREFKQSIDDLPFKLTSAQNKVIAEIIADLKAPLAMQRLLQGDVGSGKTVVAALTMALVARSGCQSALMAPTEILAQQHFRTIGGILDRRGIRVALLTGSTPGAMRAETLTALAEGKISIVIGTHALISEDVKYGNLAYVIVDEQHRFGVAQREALLEKGALPDLLVMTATPIPRTLALTAYGDLDLSVIDQMPIGRKPIRTALRTEADRPRIYKFVRDEVARGNQVFIIYPLVEESLKSELKAATKSFQELQTEVFPDLTIGMVHGQMKKDQRDLMMAQFERREVSVMVATTVVEVGIDIPDATVILIEHAERFGLSQLHQLRGRVGRSDKKSYCIMITDFEPLSESYQRLQRFVECADGFKIAELDLELRGPGDLLGNRQSGMPIFRVANLTSDLSLILTAREWAHKLLQNGVAITEEEKPKLNLFIKKQRMMERTGGAA